MDENKSKIELVEELQRCEDLIGKLESELKKREDLEDKLIDYEDFLSETALKLVELPREQDIYDFITKRLNQLIKDSVINLAKYDKASDSFQAMAMAGQNETVDMFYRKFLASNLQDIYIPLEDYEENLKVNFFKGGILKLEKGKGLYNILAGRLPLKICQGIENVMNIGDIYVMAFKWGEKPYATANIFVKKKTQIDINVLETFKNLASVAFQRREAEEKILENEERTRRLLSESFHAWATHACGKILDCNLDAVKIMGGVKVEDFIGKPLIDFVHPDFKDDASKRIVKMYDEGGTAPLMEERWLKLDGTPLDVEAVATSFHYDGVPAVHVVFRDITQRKTAEEKLRKSIKEKEILLKEIHHRVKNNLMVISSLLNLQSRYIRDREVLDIFRESQSRAKSMALIHEKLYRSTDLKRINFGEYIQVLATDLFHTYMQDSARVNLNMDLENLMVDINTSVPLGLIVNELVTNSMKHAFPEGVSGEVSLGFHKHKNVFSLVVSDNGVGFPEELDYRKTDSLGLQLVINLVGQIDGDITLDRSKGTKFTINFTEVEYRE